MKLQEVKSKLEAARKKQRELRKYIDKLRQTIRDAGEDPDARNVDLTPRNKKIYIAWKDGQTFMQIAKEYRLSTTTISNVCNRIEHALENKRFHFEKYKDLLPYK